MSSDRSEISQSEKEQLLVEILSSKDFCAPDRGPRLRQFLQLLFSAHCRGVTMTQGQIYAETYGRETGEPMLRGQPNVRVTVRRLRQALERFREGEGVHREIRLDLPTGAYQLVFYRLQQPRGLHDWFWNQYLNPTAEATSFGIVRPERSRDIYSTETDPARLMESYAPFFKMFVKRDRELPILSPDWQKDQYGISETMRHCSIIVADDTAMTLTRTLPTNDTYGIGGSAMAFLADGNFELIMFRDPSGRAAVVRRKHPSTVYREDQDFYLVRDSRQVSYVLLTRCSDSRTAATTLLSSADPDALSRTAAFVTSDEGLKKIAEHAAFQASYLPRDRTPVDFQILFSIEKKRPDLRGVAIYDIRLGAINYVFPW